MIKLQAHNYIDKELFQKIAFNLPAEYDSLDTEIIIFDREAQLNAFVIENIMRYSIADLLNPNFAGGYDGNTNIIFLMPFKYEDIENYRVQTFAIFFHELRHAWQFHYQRKQYMEDNANYIPPTNGDCPEYREQWCEKDANRFMEKMMKHYELGE